MDFTREPIIETVITPKEGCKLVVRSSKNPGQEEFFVDALEVVAFGNALFYRSLERPKVFLVPVNDYEILEVREARMVLKNVGIERAIKIGGGKAVKEAPAEKSEQMLQSEAADEGAESDETANEAKSEKRRDRRRQGRRRRGRDEEGVTEQAEAPIKTEEAFDAPPREPAEAPESLVVAAAVSPGTYTSTILPPPSMLISETIARYRDNALFKGAFYVKEEVKEESEEESAKEPSGAPLATSEHHEDVLEALSMQNVTLEPSEFGVFGLSEQEQNLDWILPLSDEPAEHKHEKSNDEPPLI